MIKLGIVMDPIAHINIRRHQFRYMLLEAQRRGYADFVYGDGRPLSD